MANIIRFGSCSREGDEDCKKTEHAKRDISIESLYASIVLRQQECPVLSDGSWNPRSDSPQEKRTATTLVQPRALLRTQPSRTAHQPFEGVSPRGDPLREARRQLLGDGHSRHHHDVAEGGEAQGNIPALRSALGAGPLPALQCGMNCFCDLIDASTLTT